MDAEKVHLAKEKETLLITLFAKALESRSMGSILSDRFADDVVRRIDYDFAKLKVRGLSVVSLAMRARLLDAWTSEFLADHPEATVLDLGCGLDSRVFRVDPPAGVRWFDLDYPEVIELRRRLYPRRDGCRMIGSSVTDPRWLREIPADRPAMIVAEGLMPYLAADDVKRLLERLTGHLPSGELAFDGYTRLGVRLLGLHPSIRATGASLHWGIDDPRELEVWIPRLKLVTELTSYDPSHIARMPRVYRVLIRVWNHVSALRRIGRLLKYRF
jgi:O-methyltransferase involved in polyketide biosynthesis